MKVKKKIKSKDSTLKSLDSLIKGSKKSSQKELKKRSNLKKILAIIGLTSFVGYHIGKNHRAPYRLDSKWARLIQKQKKNLRSI